MEQICQEHNLAIGLGVFAYSIIEAWMGKKKYLGAGSVLEFVGLAGLIFFSILWEKYGSKD